MKPTFAERAARAAEKVLKYEGMAAAAEDPAERESARQMAQQFREEERMLRRGVDPLSFEARQHERARRRMRLSG